MVSTQGSPNFNVGGIKMKAFLKVILLAVMLFGASNLSFADKQHVNNYLQNGWSYMTLDELQAYLIGNTEAWKRPGAGMYFESKDKCILKNKGKIRKVECKIDWNDRGDRGGEMCPEMGKKKWCHRYIYTDGAVALVYDQQTDGTHKLLEGNQLEGL